MTQPLDLHTETQQAALPYAPLVGPGSLPEAAGAAFSHEMAPGRGASEDQSNSGPAPDSHQLRGTPVRPDAMRTALHLTANPAAPPFSWRQQWTMR